MTHATTPIRIDYYTDPLCCWSWALEPVWQSIRHRHGDRVVRQCILGGMLASWREYHDPVNDIQRPAQMAPLWHFAGQTAGVRIDPTLWHTDPPASSFPASVAVKAAALQDAELGDAYLALAREAVMARRLNIARPAVLLQLADDLRTQRPTDFDAERFRRDLVGAEALDAFREDLQHARVRGIGRFPTMVVRGPGGTRGLTGYQSADALERVIAAVADGDC
jgi:predicted DsbA family dithiol-disulfide isomerase